MELRAFSDQIICNQVIVISVIKCNVDNDKEKVKFFEALNGATKSIQKGYIILIVMGDINAKVREDNTGLVYVKGQQGKYVTNINGGGLWISVRTTAL